MNRPVKFVLYSLCGLIVLVLLLIIVAITVIDPNAYKGRIEKIASQQIGRELKIAGDIDLSLFPWLGLSIRDVSLANRQGFAKQDFLSVQSLGVKVKFLPLLSGDINVGGVELKGFAVNLTRNRKGMTNWEDLSGKSAAEPTGKLSRQKKQKPTEQKQPASMPMFTVQKVDISSGTVNWTDKTKGVSLQLRDMNLSAGPIKPSEEFSFSFGFRMENDKPDISMALKGSGEALADLEKRKFSVKEFELVNNFKGDAVPGGQGELTLKTEAAIDLAAETATISDLSIETYGLTLTGSAKGENILKSPLLQGKINLDELNPKELMQRLGQSPPSTADKGVLTKARAQMEFRSNTKSVQISKLKAKLDQTNITGRLSLENITKQRPAIDLRLQLDKLNVDRYLPPKDEKKVTGKEGRRAGQEEENGRATGKGKTVLPVELFRQLELDGQININELIVQKLRLQNLILTIAAHKGLVEIRPLKADFYHGNLKNTTRLDVRNRTPKIQTENRLSRVNLGPLLQDLIGKRIITGRTEIESAVDTTGSAPKDWIKNVSGNLSFLAQNGTIRGLNIPQLIGNTIRTFKGQEAKSSGNKSTDFAQIKAWAKLQQGIARESNLSITSPLLQINGSGIFNLVKKTLNYSLQAKLTQEFKKQSGVDLGHFGGTPIPINISGPLTDPAYTVNIKSVIEEMGRERIKEELQKQLLDKLGKEGHKESDKTDKLDPKEMLKGIFQR